MIISSRDLPQFPIRALTRQYLPRLRCRRCTRTSPPQLLIRPQFAKRPSHRPDSLGPTLESPSHRCHRGRFPLENTMMVMGQQQAGQRSRGQNDPYRWRLFDPDGTWLSGIELCAKACPKCEVLLHDGKIVNHSRALTSTSTSRPNPPTAHPTFCWRFQYLRLLCGRTLKISNVQIQVQRKILVVQKHEIYLGPAIPQFWWRHPVKYFQARGPSRVP